MRLIDADDLGVGRCSKDVLPAAYCAGWNGLLGLIEKAPTVDVAPVDQWISAKDKPPEAEAEVLAVCNRNGFRFVVPAIYEDGTVLSRDSMWNWYELDAYGTYSEENDDYFVPAGWWENREFTPDDVYNNPVDCAVTHWMPLPELPKMDGGNENDR